MVTRAADQPEPFSGFPAHEIETMPMDEFARLTGREFVIEPTTAPRAVAEAQHPAHSVEHPGIDFAQLSMSEYKRVREHLGDRA